MADEPRMKHPYREAGFAFQSDIEDASDDDVAWLASAFRGYVDKVLGTDTPRDLLDALLTYGNGARQKIRAQKERKRHTALMVAAVSTPVLLSLAGALVSQLKSPWGLLVLLPLLVLLWLAQRYRRAADQLDAAEQEVEGTNKDLRVAAFKLSTSTEGQTELVRVVTDLRAQLDRQHSETPGIRATVTEPLPDEEEARTLEALRNKR